MSGNLQSILVRSCFVFYQRSDEELAMISNSNVMLENKAVYMEMFKNGDYTVFESMLVSDFRRLIDWKIKFEQEKKKQMDEQMKENQKNSAPSKRQYIRK